MGFLWGKRDEFEKDNNTIRELYRNKPSENFLYRFKQLSLPKIWILREEDFSDSMLSDGGIVYSTNKAYSSYIEFAFLTKSYSDTVEADGSVVFKTTKTLNDFIEYTFLTYPFTGYMEDIFQADGGIVFKTEGGNFD